MKIAHYLFSVILAVLLTRSHAEPHVNVIITNTNPYIELNKHQNKNASLVATLACVFFAILCFILFQLYVCHELSIVHHKNPILGAIKKYPIFSKRVRIMNKAATCLLCLTEFVDRDTTKMIPKCRHVFHKRCIDAWLPSHMTCPICRQRITDDNTTIHIDVHVPVEHAQQDLGRESTTEYMEAEVTVVATEQQHEKPEHVVTETDTVVGPGTNSTVKWLN